MQWDAANGRTAALLSAYVEELHSAKSALHSIPYQRPIAYFIFVRPLSGKQRGSSSLSDESNITLIFSQALP